ncbi:39S ribosomal protein L35, mitochondrial [Spea bombifrons]|uniref:39S ribosomal protein L35, mitochondrial n=1 Tax=Spea bombifrons TaxID=233779 RepID=UPI00234BE897|nr:39S ribosomal protein L35, mitochondrial [Spea bombifrons]
MALPSMLPGAMRGRPWAFLRHLPGLFYRGDAPALIRPAFNPAAPVNVRQASGLCSVVSRSTHQTFLAAATRLSVPGNAAPAIGGSVLSRVSPLLPSLLSQPSRPLTYCSVRSGKRKSVKAVVDRFLRLHCGLWVRKKAGYKKKLWKKLAARRKRLREEVICNKTQSKLLDKMTTSFWKRRNWYIGDPYQKYHDRTNLKV